MQPSPRMPLIARLGRRWLAALALAALAACGGGGGGAGDEEPAPPEPPTQATPARIEVAPGTVLLTERGATKALVARVFDATGNPIQAKVEWTSSRPSQIAVDAAGTVTAAGSGGSSQVTARIGTLASPPLVVVHTPVPAGAVLVTDANIVGDPVETDPDAPAQVGATYVVRLSGMAAPRVGALLINTEAKPVAGRVTRVETSNGEHRVTLALVTAPEMFPNLALDESIDLNLAEVEVPAALREQYDIRRDGNTFTFVPKPGQFTVAAAGTGGRKAIAATGGRAQAAATPVGTAALPPFTNCETTLLGAGGAAGLPVGLSLPPQFTFLLNNRLDVKYSSATGLERFVIHGEPSFTINGGLRALVAFEGKVTCEVELLIIRIPVGGPLSLIIGGLVPVGVGVELAGKVTVASMGISTNVVGKTTVDVGISCPGGGDCSLVNTFGPVDIKPVPVIDVPSIGDLRLEPSASVYGFVKASIGNPLLKSLRFDALSVKAGAAARASLAPMSTQIADPLYKSDYKLLTELRAGAGTQLSGLAAMLGLRAISGVDLLVNTTLASSPLGTVTADRPLFARGDTVNVSVQLDPTKIEFPPALGPYNVNEIVLVRRVDITTQQELARVTAASGQTQFDIPFVAADAGRADEVFAFVVTALAPVDFLALELGPAKNTVNAVTTRSISLRTIATDGTGLVGQEDVDDGLAGGFVRTVETTGTFLAVPQTTRVASTEDSMGSNGGAVALSMECNGDVVGGTAFSVVRFTLARETLVTLGGTLSAAGRSTFGGIFLENRTNNTSQISRELSDSVRSLTVAESLLLPPADYTMRLTMSHGCGVVIGQPTASSVQGRIELSFAP
jgi:hypothetical protein